MELDHFLTPFTKINSKWIKDLNVRPETIKLLEENRGKTLSDINQSRILYDQPPRVMEIKAKIYKFNAIPIKLPAIFFHRTRTNNFKICMEIQKTSNSQSNLEKEEWNWRNQLA